MPTEDSKRYNGWANYETWAVNLWLDNDEGLQEAAKEIVTGAWATARPQPDIGWTRKDQAAFDSCDALKTYLEEKMPDLGASLWADLLGAAFSEVVWLEIAKSWLAEQVEESKTDDR